MTTQRSEPVEARAPRRPWDNTGLRNRVEGRDIEGVDVLALQSSVVERDADRPRRRIGRTR